MDNQFKVILESNRIILLALVGAVFGALAGIYVTNRSFPEEMDLRNLPQMENAHRALSAQIDHLEGRPDAPIVDKDWQLLMAAVDTFGLELVPMSAANISQFNIRLPPLKNYVAQISGDPKDLLPLMWWLTEITAVQFHNLKIETGRQGNIILSLSGQ